MTKTGICLVWRWTVILTLALCYLTLVRLQNWPALPVGNALLLHPMEAVAAFYLSTMLSFAVIANAVLLIQWQSRLSETPGDPALPLPVPEAWIERNSRTLSVLQGAQVFGAFILPLYLTGHSVLRVLDRGRVCDWETFNPDTKQSCTTSILEAFGRISDAEYRLLESGNQEGISWYPHFSPSAWAILIASAIGLSLHAWWRGYQRWKK